MHRFVTALMIATAMLVSTSLAQAGIATYEDFTGYGIRPGSTTIGSTTYTTGVIPNDGTSTFAVTAVGGGKVALGTSAINGATVSDFINLRFTNSVSVTTASRIVYPNFWVTDGNPAHYALIALHSINGQTQDDLPVYQAITTGTGMDATSFGNMAVRVYATNTTDLNWLFPGAVRMAKFGGWAQSLWKSGAALVNDAVHVSDLGNLYFGSPFTSEQVPGLASPNNPEWIYASTGDPQTPDTFFLMCGDTSGSVQNFNYTLGGIQLEWATNAVVPEPASVTVWSMLGLVGIAVGWRMRRQSAA